MKKLFTTLMLAGGLFAGANTFAQSFSSHHDTVTFTTGGSYDAHNDITNLSSSALTIQWRVSTTNFPSDWLASLGVCDNATCITGAGLWPSGTTYECVYPVSTTPGTFKVQVDLSSAAGVTSTGTYYLRVRINNKFGTASDTGMQTYIVTRSASSSVSVTKVSNDIVIYPNPATSALNVIYDAGADVKNIAIYNIIGKQMNMFRVTDNNSANLNVDNLPTGIYFVRLLNSRGDVVTTRKFTKQ